MFAEPEKKRKYKKRDNQAPNRKCINTWHSILKRINNYNGNYPTYKNRELLFTYDQFKTWFLPRYIEWREANPLPIKASIDRIDNDGHYELSNLQILEAGANTRKDRHNVTAPAGMSWCCVCKAYINYKLFYKDSSNYNGLDNRCKQHC